jgi:AcrR family transcriptional regulator
VKVASGERGPSDSDLPTPLRRGRNDLSPEEVVEHQRERVIAAVAKVVAGSGYASLTVERVINAARISRTTFYQLFDNLQDAVLVAHEAIFGRLLASIREACEREGEWPDKVDQAIGAIVEFAITRPDQAQLLATDLLAADMATAARARESHDQLATLLAGLREHYPGADSLPSVTEAFLVSGMRGVLVCGLRSGKPDQIEALRPQLVEFALLPYLAVSGQRPS